MDTDKKLMELEVMGYFPNEPLHINYRFMKQMWGRVLKIGESWQLIKDILYIDKWQEYINCDNPHEIDTKCALEKMYFDYAIDQYMKDMPQGLYNLQLYAVPRDKVETLEKYSYKGSWDFLLNPTNTYTISDLEAGRSFVPLFKEFIEDFYSSVIKGSIKKERVLLVLDYYTEHFLPFVSESTGDILVIKLIMKELKETIK